jgi:hypothetical protein
MMKISENEIKLKFGVMCTGTQFRGWQAQCIQDLLSMDNVELSLLIIEEKPEIEITDNQTANSTNISFSKNFSKESIILKPIKNINNFLSRILKIKLFHIYKNKFVKTKVDEPVDLTQLLSNTERIFCKVIKHGKFSQFFQDRDLKLVASYNLDFILRFGFNIIRGEILDIPKYGVWSFHHDDEEKYRGGPPCFWEIYYNDPVTGAILQRLTDRLDGGIILKKGYFKTNLTSYSGNIDDVYKEAAKWPIHVARDIQNRNSSYFDKTPTKTQALIYKEPTNIQLLFFFFNIGKRKIFFLFKHKLRKFQWNIGVINEPIENLLNYNNNCNNKLQIHWYPLKKSDNFFLADPFGQLIDETLFILCEKCNMDTGYGELTTIEMKNKIYSNPKKIFTDINCHLSYPFIFNYKDEIYLVPESRRNRSILLYKAEKFPEKWIKVNTIARDINASDSTLFYYNDMWWLMYTDMSIGESSSLCILYSENLLGKWKSHLGNPVKQDVRSARPAGTPFIKNKVLFRPSQDCSRNYGGKITINEVKILTPSQYLEEIVTVINPTQPFSEGTHTIASVGNYTLIDGCRSSFWSKFY